MVLKSSQERVKTLLKDTITLLCKNGLEFKRKFNVEALIGVTLDDDEVFLVSINQLVKADGCVNVENVDTPNTTTNAPAQSKSGAGQKRKHSETDSIEMLDTVKVEPGDTDNLDLQTGSARSKSDVSVKDNAKPSNSGKNCKTDTRAITDGINTVKDDPEDCTALPDKHKEESKPKRKAKHTEIVYEKDSSDDENDNCNNDYDSDDPVVIKEEAAPDSFLQSISQEVNDSLALNFPEFPDGQFMSESGLGPGDGPNSSMLWSSTTPSGQQTPRQTQRQVPSSTATSGEMSQQDSQSHPQQQQYPAGPPYICKICGTTFTAKQSLKIHEEMHQGKFKYYCSFCNRGFMYSTHLRGHMVSHTGEKEFKCSLCQKSFVYKKNVRKHMKDVHGVNVDKAAK